QPAAAGRARRQGRALQQERGVPASRRPRSGARSGSVRLGRHGGPSVRAGRPAACAHPPGLGVGGRDGAARRRARALVLRGAAGALVFEALDGGVSRLLRLPLAGGAAVPLPLPFEGSVREMRADPARRDVIVALEGWTRPPAVYRIDADGRASDTGWQKPLALDTSAFEARRVMVPAADGTPVPLTILLRRDLVLDGSHPAVITGYG